MNCLRTALIIAAALTNAMALAETSTVAPLELRHTVDLPGISGDLDHLAIDPSNGRLLMAAEDNGTVRVINLKTDKQAQTVRGFKTPHSLLEFPAMHKVFITDGSDAVQVRDSNTLQLIKKISTTPGADSIGFDAERGLLFAVTGGKDVDMKNSFISVIDVKQDKLLNEIPIDAAHVEAMALERSGSHLFVNVTDKNYLAVIDRKTMKVVEQWPIHEAKQNAPIAIDEANHRLFIVCRDPGTLLVLDSNTGKTIANFPTGAHADEVIFDAAHKRIYVASGEGRVYAYQQESADRYVALTPVISKAGAKTALLAADGSELFISVSPGEGKTGAQLLVYHVN